jgi:hypothetical protein
MHLDYIETCCISASDKFVLSTLSCFALKEKEEITQPHISVLHLQSNHSLANTKFNRSSNMPKTLPLPPPAKLHLALYLTPLPLSMCTQLEPPSLCPPTLSHLGQHAPTYPSTPFLLYPRLQPPGLGLVFRLKLTATKIELCFPPVDFNPLKFTIL